MNVIQAGPRSFVETLVEKSPILINMRGGHCSYIPFYLQELNTKIFIGRQRWAYMYALGCQERSG